MNFQVLGYILVCCIIMGIAVLRGCESKGRIACEASGKTYYKGTCK